jgi:transglutaminase-like putative cysteine protease
MASTTYNGKVWTIDDDLKFTTLNAAYFGLRITSSDGVENRVTVTPITRFGRGFVPTALNILELRFPAPLLWNPHLFAFRSEKAIKKSYGFTVYSFPDPLDYYPFRKQELRGLSVSPDPRYLQLPGNISDRVRDLAQRVTAGAKSPYEKAKALEQFLKTNYTYDFGYKNAPKGREAADWFLFEEQRGVCANFNHAFVVMARSIGLPARPVVGWAIAATDAEQEVRASQAHQWAEVHFEGAGEVEGWLTFDATAPGGAPYRVPRDLPSRAPPPVAPAAAIPAATATAVRATPVSAPGPTLAPSPTPALIETTTEITFVDSATKGHWFRVIGTVMDNRGRPLDGTPVDIFLNKTKEHGGLLLGRAEMKDGFFGTTVQAPKDIPVGEYQVMAHAMPSGSYQDSWSDPPINIGTETAMTLEGPDVVVAGRVASFGGVLREEFGTPLVGERISLSIGNVIDYTTFTTTDGTFSFQHRFTDTGFTTARVYFQGKPFYISSQAEHNLRVVLETTLTIRAPQSAHMEEPVLFSGQLRDMFDTPVAREEILLSSTGQGEMGLVETSKDGTFALEHEFSKGGAFTVRARFAGTDLYLPSSAETSVEVLMVAGGGGLSRWIMASLAAVAFLGLGGGFYYYRRHRGLPEPAPPLQSSPPPAPPAPAYQAIASLQGSGRPKTILYIELPQIVSPLPLVWGLGESLDIRITLRDENQMPVPNRSLEVSLGGEQRSAETDSEGVCTIQHGFHVKGTFAIAVRFRGDKEYRGTSQETSLRIVEYREEVVELYNDSIQGLRGRGVNLPPECTPRETEELVRRQWTGATEAAVGQMVEGFEVADYSLHHILRDSYLRMYLACNQLMERREPVNEATI